MEQDNAMSFGLSYGLSRAEAVFEIPTIMVSSLLPPSSSVGPRAERSVKLRVRATHSSWMFPSASAVRMYAECGGPGTSKTVDGACTCAGDKGLVD
jgi:hypothetical protein